MLGWGDGTTIFSYGSVGTSTLLIRKLPGERLISLVLDIAMTLTRLLEVALIRYSAPPLAGSKGSCGAGTLGCTKESSPPRRNRATFRLSPTLSPASS